MDRLALSWQSIGHLLEQSAAKFGDMPFLICGDQRVTFASANAWCNKIANAMRTSLKVGKGDRVSVMLPAGLDAPIIWLATAKLGATVVLTNTNVQQDDLAYLLSDAGTSQIILDSRYLPTLQGLGEQLRDLDQTIIVGEPVEGYPSLKAVTSELSEHFPLGDVTEIDLATIQYTAGVTGDPKGCMTPHRYWLTLGHLLTNAYMITPEDTMLTAQPFYQLDPQYLMVVSLVSGAPLVMLPHFSAESFWQTVHEHEVTFAYLPSAVQDELMGRPVDTSLEQGHHLRLVTASGIDAQYHADYQDRWGVAWREVFRMAEAGVAMIATPADASSVGTGALGKLLPYRSARVVDSAGADVHTGTAGELLLKGDPMMFGYWDKSEETVRAMRDGWLHTGDLVSRDDHGYFYWAGRVSE